jgi:hypothetical protein
VQRGEGGASGPAVAPGKPERSLLWMQIDSGRMPMGGKMTNANKQLIRSYLEHGRQVTSSWMPLQTQSLSC